MVVGDLGRVLSDPAQHLVCVPRALDQALHGEKGVIAHFLMDEVPRLLLPSGGAGASAHGPTSVCMKVCVVLVVREQ